MAAMPASAGNQSDSHPGGPPWLWQRTGGAQFPLLMANTLKVWDLSSGQELHTLASHSAPVNGVAVTPHGRRVVSASADNTPKVWDLQSGAGIAGFTCDGAATCCTFKGSDKVFAGDSGGRLYYLKLQT